MKHLLVRQPDFPLCSNNHKTLLELEVPCLSRSNYGGSPAQKEREELVNLRLDIPPQEQNSHSIL